MCSRYCQSFLALLVFTIFVLHPEIHAKNVNDVDSTLKLKSISLEPNPFSPAITENTIKGSYEIKGSALEGKGLTHFLKQDVTIKNTAGAIVGYLSTETEVTYRPDKGNELVAWEVITKWDGKVDTALLPDGQYSIEITGTLIARKENKKDDNIEAVTSVKIGTVSLDNISPETTAVVTPLPNDNGWLKTDAVIKFTATDNLSGVAKTFYKQNGGNPVEGTQVEIAEEGNHIVSYWSVDNAGNTETAKDLSLKIDKTAPTASAAVTPAANAEGWNNSDVTVKITSQDALSGVDKIYLKIGDGEAVEGTEIALNTNATVSFWCTDKAGNQSEVGTVSVKIDKDAPILTASQEPAVNAAGWNHAAVVVTFAAQDTPSGIANVTAPVTVDQEGANIEVAGEATDKAGNKATTTYTVNIDKTAPAITGIVPAAETKVTEPRPEISANIVDALSGIDAASVAVTLNGNAVPAAFDPQTGKVTVTLAGDLESGNFQLTVTAADNAGNATTAESDFSVSLAPIVTEQIGSSGFVSGGTWVEFLGSNFAENMSVKFGENESVEIRHFNEGKIYALTPAGQAGIVNVTLSNGPGRDLMRENAFEYLPELELKIDGLGDLKDGDIITGKTKLTLSGTVSGGKGPYHLELTHYSDPTTVIIPITGNHWEVTVNFEEGFHYVNLILSDVLNNFNWISFYYFYDKTPPAAPANVKAYITDNGDGATLVWPASASKDTVQYEITITGEGTSKTETVDADVFNYYTIAGLTPDKEYIASIKAVDGAENKSITPPAVTFTTKKFFYSHNLKKLVGQKLISLSDNPVDYSQIAWHNDGGKIDLADLRGALQGLSDSTYVEGGYKLSLFEGYDNYGYGGTYCDTAWKKISVPDPENPWISTLGFNSTTANIFFQQIDTELARISQWKYKPGSFKLFKETINAHMYYDVMSGSSWNDCLTWLYYDEAVSDSDQLEVTIYGLRLWALYLDWPMWWILPSGDCNFKLKLDMEFFDNRLLDKYFWTDHNGAITPGSKISQIFEYGAEPTLETFKDPIGNIFPGENIGGSVYYSNYGVVTSNIYGSYILRNMVLSRVIISPEKTEVSIGQEVGLSGVVEYYAKFNADKNGVWDYGEKFFDYDGDGQYDQEETFIDEAALYVFVYIPTTIQCTQDGAVVTNHGSSKFVGAKTGKYTVTTPQGGSAEILVSGVDVKITDSSGIEISALDEDTFGALLPLYDGDINVATGKVTFKNFVPEDLKGKYIVSVGNGIGLFNGDEPIIEPGKSTEFTREQINDMSLDVRGIAVSDSVPVTIKFFEENKDVPTYEDSAIFSTVGLELGEIELWYQGSDLKPLEFKKISQHDAIGLLGDDFIENKTLGIFLWQDALKVVTETWEKNLTFKIKGLDPNPPTATEGLIVDVGKLDPKTSGISEESIQKVKDWIAQRDSKMEYIVYKKAGFIEAKVFADVTLNKTKDPKQNEEDTNGIKEIVSKCKNGYKLNLIILKFGIKKPYDEDDITNAEKLGLKIEDYFNTENDGPYCYSYQCVADKSAFGDIDKKRLQHVEALLNPSIDVIEGKLPENFSMGLKWEIDEKAGQLNNVNTLIYDKANQQNKDKILIPSHTPPDNIEGEFLKIKDNFLSLKFYIKENDDEILSFSDSKKIEVFKDHLARDMANFLHEKECANPKDSNAPRIQLKEGYVNKVNLTCGPSMTHAHIGVNRPNLIWVELKNPKGNWSEIIYTDWNSFIKEKLDRNWKVWLKYMEFGNEQPLHYETVGEEIKTADPITYGGDNRTNQFRHEKIGAYYDRLKISTAQRRVYILKP